MSIHQELDEWAYDIEQEYKSNKCMSSRKRRQYLTICKLRDKYYNLYLENFKEKSKYGWVPDMKSCIKRFHPDPPSRQPKIN